MSSIYDEYFDLQQTYERKYGLHTAVLMQVGSFFELYALDQKNLKTIEDVCRLCNLQLTKKNKKLNVSPKNPYMAGIPIWSRDKYIQLLSNHHYTIVLVEQVTPPPNPIRKVTQIISPGTVMDDEFIPSSDSNYLMSIYIEEHSSTQMYAGLSAIDVSTGKNFIYETYSTQEDPMAALDQIYRCIKSCQPAEIIITHQHP